MESSYLVIFSVVGGALLLLSVLVAVIGWNRVSALHQRQEELLAMLTTQALPKQLEKAMVTAEGSRDRVDTALLELGKFREGVHGEMQRFYAIMRRNEKAVSTVAPPGSSPADGGDPPDEISVSALKGSDTEPEMVSKAELRKQARAAGL